MVLDYDLADSTVAYVFDGPVDEQTIKALRTQIERKLEIHDHINVYLEDRGVEYFTLYSVIVGIIFPLQHHKRFRKVAMVTDRSWIHLLSAINNQFISGDIRNYSSDKRVEAMQWVSKVNSNVYLTSHKSPPVNMFADFSFADNTVGYLIEGTMDKDAILELRSQVLEKLKEHDKINLYLEDSNIEHFSLSAATIGALFPLEYAKRFNKIALVTDRKWIHALAAIDNILIGATLKYFPEKDRLSAISWIADVNI